MSDKEKYSLLEKIGKASEAKKQRGKRKRAEEQLSREEFKTEVDKAITLATQKNKENYIKAMLSINKARNASTIALKETYIEKLRYHLSLYMYMQSLHDAFVAMKEKLDIQEANEAFADILFRFSIIQKSAPRTNEDMRKTTKKAFKDMKNDNLGDLSQVVSEFVKNTLKYTGSYSFDDTLINDLISGKKKLEDLPGGPDTVNGSVQTQPDDNGSKIPPNLVEQAMDLETMLGQL